jgi:SAM-dependent methyltransferase
VVRFRADVRRLLLGFRGLALLRGWPAGDPTVAARQMDAMRALLDGDEIALEIDDDGLLAAYEVWAATYDVESNALIRAEEMVVAELLGDLPVGRAVDAACGTGRHAQTLSSLGHDVVGVDQSEAMLGVARRKGLDGRLVRAELGAIPIRDESVDLAVCSLALTHVIDLTHPISELARVVRPGGWVLLSDLHPIAAATGGQAVPSREDGSRMLATNRAHWPGDYIRAFRGAQLEIERCEEPRVDDALLAGIEDPDLRESLEAATIGLPIALIWLLRRT